MEPECNEQWASLRYGNIGREKNKGFKETKCRVCGAVEERVRYIWVSRETREKLARSGPKCRARNGRRRT